LDARVEVGVEEAVELVVERVVEFLEERDDAVGYAQGPDRVPDADEADAGVVAVLLLEARNLGAVLGMVGALVEREHAVDGVDPQIAVLLRREQVRAEVGKLRIGVAPQDAAAEHHPREAARAVGAARKAEDIDLVARLEILAQRTVRVLDLVEQSPAERAAGELRAVRADALEISDDLVGSPEQRLR